MTSLHVRYLAGLRHHPRLTATLSHLALSALLCGTVGLLVIGLLYPGEYVTMTGGATLFWMVVGVDVTLGPLLTAVVFNPRKPRQELVRDLAVIAALQLAALAYGAHTLYAGRPVALVFEVDRFRLLSPSMIATDELPKAPAEFRALPTAQVWTLGTRRPVDAGQERLEAIELALQGYDIAQRPTYWVPYVESRATALAAAKPAAAALRSVPGAAGQLAALARRAGFDAADARVLPVIARHGNWVAVLTPTGDVAGFLPFDGF